MGNCKNIDNTQAQTSDKQKTITPACALELLKKGNKRFVENVRLNRNLQEQVKVTSKGQHPFAVVLGCIDSRAAAELVFDQGIGDVFNTRIAGNFINDDILGGIEFAVEKGKVKLIVVLGHTGCGAISAAVDTHGKPFNNPCTHMGPMVAKLYPAVEATPKLLGESESDYKNRVAETNVRLMVDKIVNTSDCIKAKLGDELSIVGGMYNISTGEVQFLTPNEQA